MQQSHMYTQEQLDIALLNNNQTEIRRALDRIELRLDKIEQKVDHKFYWLIGAMVSLAGVMARGFHWI